MKRSWACFLLASVGMLAVTSGCEVYDPSTADSPEAGQVATGQAKGPEEPDPADVYQFAGGCYAIGDSDGRWLRFEGDGVAFAASNQAGATPFFMQASDLATYLLYGPNRGYVVLDGNSLVRRTSLRSDLSEHVARYESPAEWVLEAVVDGADPRFRLRHRYAGKLISQRGVTSNESDAALLRIERASGCAQFPEMSLDAVGTVDPPEFEDGSVWGIVEPHSHILGNYGFGGGGLVHGAPYHRLGVEHALSDCAGVHGFGGTRDVLGTIYDEKVNTDFFFQDMLPDLIGGNFDGAIHETAGYPEFTEWPSAHFSSTHQVQYYRWIERAWMGGLRMMVQHAVSNSVLCELSQGLGAQTPVYGCSDMAAVDRQIEEIYGMQDYIDAQWGGPGKGFFRVVTSPQQAREVITDGKLAIVLGIETSNLFDCALNPRPGLPECDEEYVVNQLNEYHRRGIRALFPNHKFDNAFSAGDGNRDFIEIGNFLSSGNMSNFVQEGCPDMPARFDKGGVAFKGFNRPRTEYDPDWHWNTDALSSNPALVLGPHLPRLAFGSLEGEYCQKHGLTDLGEFLIREMMKRGMIVEVDHLPKHSYASVFEMLGQYYYPPAATHGSTGPLDKVYELGGISKVNIGTCRDPNRKGAMLDGLRSRIEAKRSKNAYPGEAFSWDLNGFAGARGPRFGLESDCGAGQEDPVTYPFPSYAGDVEFRQPRLGNRVVDFNHEGLVHIGMLPEVIDEVRRDANSDAELEPLFRSAEAYLRMWEKAEFLSAIIQQSGDDSCPLDPEKTELGVCGCGVPDTDTDGDGVADCVDRCAENPDKTAPLICGCDTTDDDTDADGVPDCNDLCPGDPDKTAEGTCGCAAAEIDTDGDGLQDCIDVCPADPEKAEPGQCGCGNADVDSDGDGSADCVDRCVNDPGKSQPGTCGCGTADTDSDGDGVPNCVELCPNDPGKTQPGACGCGVAEGNCGLLGTYFGNKDLNSVRATRVDPTIDFDWGWGKPHPNVADHHFSVRWTGQVRPPATGTYTFYTVADDGVRLWVDGRQIVDDWSNHSARERSGTIHLEAGRRYSIRLEYYEDHWDAVVRLLWSGPSVPKQIVPQARLVARP